MSATFEQFAHTVVLETAPVKCDYDLAFVLFTTDGIGISIGIIIPIRVDMILTFASRCFISKVVLAEFSPQNPKPPRMFTQTLDNKT